MNRDLFLRDLRNELTPLSLNEQEQIIDEYISIFEIKKDDGLSDEEIISELGDPRKIAQQFVEELDIDKEYRYAKNHHVRPENQRNVGLFILMMFFNVLIGVWLAFAAFMFVFSFFIAGIVLLISSIALPFVVGGFSILTAIASMLIMIGLGLIFMSVSIILFKLLLNGLIIHIKWLQRLL